MTLAERLQQLATSSMYRFGDVLSFSVPVTAEQRLPGRHMPHVYTSEFSQPGDAAVVCPGNGGLVAQLLLQGAASVTAFEPRPRFHDALKAVVEILQEVHPGKKVTVSSIPPLEKFDTILWFEGVDEHDPAFARQVIQMLKPNGRLKIEVPHGTSTATEGKANSWRPTPEALATLANSLAKLSAPTPGRRGNHKTYVVTEPKAASKPASKPEAKPEAKPEPKIETKGEPQPAKKPEAKVEDPSLPPPPLESKPRPQLQPKRKPM